MRTVLLVDDDQDDLEIFSELMLAIDDSLLILKAHTGHEALSIIENIHPDYIFLDINMPLMTGLECLGEIRKRYPKVSSIVTVLSTSQNARHKIETETKGATYYTKPASITDMKEIFYRLLG